MTHVCVSPSYRTDFVIDSLQSTLIESYALQPIGGDLVKQMDGSTVDLEDQTRAVVSGQTGFAQLRMI